MRMYSEWEGYSHVPCMKIHCQQRILLVLWWWWCWCCMMLLSMLSVVYVYSHTIVYACRCLHWHMPSLSVYVLCFHSIFSWYARTMWALNCLMQHSPPRHIHQNMHTYVQREKKRGSENRKRHTHIRLINDIWNGGTHFRNFARFSIVVLFTARSIENKSHGSKIWRWKHRDGFLSPQAQQQKPQYRHSIVAIIP